MRWTEENGGCWMTEEAAAAIERLRFDAALAPLERFDRFRSELRAFVPKMRTRDVEREHPGYSSPFGRLTETQLVKIRHRFNVMNEEHREQTGQSPGIFEWRPESDLVSVLSSLQPGELTEIVEAGNLVPWRRDRDGMLWLRVRVDEFETELEEAA